MADIADIPEVAALLDELTELAPQRIRGDQARSISYRLGEDEPINDALDDYETELQDWKDWQNRDELPFIWPIEPDKIRLTPIPLVAVDTGLIRLGETEDGLIIALRGTLVVVNGGQTQLNLYRTGPIYLRHSDRPAILHRLGTNLGSPNLFVEIEDGKPVRVKSGVADNIQAYSDRFRNWFERILQRIAVQSIQGGIILLDGALTTNTRDTPTEYFRQFSKLANERGNLIVALSKQSRIQIGNRGLRFWLAEQPYKACYRRLTDQLDSEMRQRILGATYAMRFSPMGLTYRVDVKPVQGQSEEEAIRAFLVSCLFRSGYPDALAQAHAHSYFTSPHVYELQAQCGAQFSLRVEPEADLASIFGPFGGRYK